jgi:hypothetical protein
LWIVTCAALTSVVVALVVLLVRERNHSAQLEAGRMELCRRQFFELEAVSKNSDARELHAKIDHFMDQSVLKLCIGSEKPVSSHAADACWIKNGDDSCYVEVVRDLLNLYRERRFNDS